MNQLPSPAETRPPWYSRFLSWLNTNSAAERALDVADAALGQVPVFGPFVALATNEGRRRLAARAEKQFQEQFGAVDRRITEQGIQIRENYIRTDQFVNLWMSAAEIFAKNTCEAKLAAVREVLLNNMRDADPSKFEEDEPVLKVLDALPEVYLRIFAKLPANDTFGFQHGFEQTLKEPSHLVWPAVWGLASHGLVQVNSGPIRVAALTEWGRLVRTRIIAS